MAPQTERTNTALCGCGGTGAPCALLSSPCPRQADGLPSLLLPDADAEVTGSLSTRQTRFGISFLPPRGVLAKPAAAEHAARWPQGGQRLSVTGQRPHGSEKGPSSLVRVTSRRPEPFPGTAAQHTQLRRFRGKTPEFAPLRTCPLLRKVGSLLRTYAQRGLGCSWPSTLKALTTSKPFFPPGSADTRCAGPLP